MIPDLLDLAHLQVKWSDFWRRKVVACLSLEQTLLAVQTEIKHPEICIYFLFSPLYTRQQFLLFFWMRHFVYITITFFFFLVAAKQI